MKQSSQTQFGKSLTSIGIGALEGCIGLRSLTLPFVGGTATENTYLGYLFGATVPDFSGGFYPPYLTRVTLLDGAPAIGDYAFYECDSLVSLTLPEGMTSIGVRAFSACVRLSAIDLPNSLTSIGDNAFFGCLSLARVGLDANASRLTALGVNAFYGCDALESVVLPTGLTTLPASCFAGCVSLATVDLGGVMQVGKNAFYQCTRLTHLKARDGIVLDDGNDPAQLLLFGEDA